MVQADFVPTDIAVTGRGGHGGVKTAEAQSIPAIGFGNRVRRMVWGVAWVVLYRSSPVPLHMWRRVVLRWFGARVGKGAHPYPECRIWAPWNLVMGDHSCLADWVDCYNVATVTLGAHATVSQHSYLCSASHDYESPTHDLIAAPIVIEERAWIAAQAFIGPGITIREGAVVGACSVVTKDVEAWTVVAGNPATPKKMRAMRSHIP